MRPLKAPGRIVEALLDQPWLNKYQIARKLGLSYSRTHEAIARLEKNGFLVSREIGKSKAGLPVKAYALSLAGLSAALFYDPARWKKIDEIAEKNKHLLPMIFGKWDLFKKHRCDEYIVLRLKNILKSVAVSSDQGEPFSNQHLAKVVQEEILAPESAPKGLILAIISDPELKRYSELTHERRLLMARHLSESMEKGLEAIKSGNPDLLIRERETRLKNGSFRSRLDRLKEIEREIDKLFAMKFQS